MQRKKERTNPLGLIFNECVQVTKRLGTSGDGASMYEATCLFCKRTFPMKEAQLDNASCPFRCHAAAHIPQEEANQTRLKIAVGPGWKVL